MEDNQRESLRLKVFEQIKKQGYPLEMRVARLFRESGRFNVAQSEYFIDPESGEFREIDVVASRDDSIGGSYFRVSFCIECKVSVSVPYVIFTYSTEHRFGDTYPLSAASYSQAGIRIIANLLNDEVIEQFGLFSMPDRLGYMIRGVPISKEIKSGKMDRAYESVIKTVKYAAARTVEGDKFNLCEIIFPIVVVDGLLFECYLDERNEIVLSEVKTSTLEWPDRPWEEDLSWLDEDARVSFGTTVRILTIESLPAFIQEAEQVINTLFYDDKVRKAAGEKEGKVPISEDEIPF